MVVLLLSRIRHRRRAHSTHEGLRMLDKANLDSNYLTDNVGHLKVSGNVTYPMHMFGSYDFRN